MDISDKLKLYLVLETDYLCIPLEKFLHEVLKAGIKTIQLRNKHQNSNEKLLLAYKILEITKQYNALLIINDNIDLAIKCNAHGIHLSIQDGDISLIKENYKNMIIGYSCNNMEDITLANKYADYAGIGPFTDTLTKKDHRKILETRGIYHLNSLLNIPAVAIGGINIDNAKEVLKAGTCGLAISSFLCKSNKPFEDTKKLLDIINERV